MKLIKNNDSYTHSRYGNLWDLLAALDFFDVINIGLLSIIAMIWDCWDWLEYSRTFSFVYYVIDTIEIYVYMIIAPITMN